MNSKVVYPGSFDPPTNGHLEMIEMASDIFSEVIVAVGENPTKTPFCSVEERMRMLRTMTMHLPNVRVDHFTGYTVTYAEKNRIGTILRGIRNTTDFEYERGIELVNRDRAPNIRTLYLTPTPKNAATSSSLVRGLMGREVGWEEWVKLYIPASTMAFLVNRENAKHSAFDAHGPTIGNCMALPSIRYRPDESHTYASSSGVLSGIRKAAMKIRWAEFMTALFGNEYMVSDDLDFQVYLGEVEEEILGVYENRIGYHNQRHILDLLNLYDRFHEALNPYQRLVILCSIWFHDYVYVPGAPAGSNESRSFEEFKTWVEYFRKISLRAKLPNSIFNDGASILKDLLYTVKYCIDATKHDGATLVCDDATGELAEFMADLDVATFALDDHAQIMLKSYAVALEYPQYPLVDVLKGRAAFLEEFAKRDPIYKSGLFLAKYPTANEDAKKNIAKIGEYLSISSHGDYMIGLIARWSEGSEK